MVRGVEENDIKIQVVAVDKEEYSEYSVGFIKKISEAKGFITAMERQSS